MTNSQHYQTEILLDRYGLKVASLLTDAAVNLPHDVTERLRFARTQALARRKVRKTETAGTLLNLGTAIALGVGDEQLTWWNRIGAALPLLALVFGLIAISAAQDDRTAREIAGIDTALLMDDLPPAAYADPGFSQFLKVGLVTE